METLNSIMLAVFRESLRNWEGEISSYADGVPPPDGKTVVVSGLSAYDIPEDYFSGGTFFYITGNQAGYSIGIGTSTVAVGFTFTSLPNPTGGDPAQGDLMAAFTPVYMRVEVIAAINEVLKEIGLLPRQRVLGGDSPATQLVFVEDQVEYPVGTPYDSDQWEMGIGHITRVEYRPDGSDDLTKWIDLSGGQWQEENGVLKIEPEWLPDPDSEARISYLDYHYDLVEDTDVLLSDVNRQWVKWKTVHRLLRNRKKAGVDFSEAMQETWETALSEIALLMQMNPTKKRDARPQQNTAGW